MTFFANFPSINVDLTIKADTSPIKVTLQDLTTTVGMTITQQDLETMCFRYTIKDGELPQLLSKQFYNSPDYDWTILYINKIANINAEWPLKSVELLNYVTAKYGSANIYATYGYLKLPENVFMDQAFMNSRYSIDNTKYSDWQPVPVTNYDYEDSINEQKRFIYIIKPENLTTFVSNFNAALVS
jgi:hypothetical protein